MTARPFTPADTEPVQALIAANGEVLAAYGVSHYGRVQSEWLPEGVNRVIERGGRVVAFCKFIPDNPEPGTAWVPCFVVDPALHHSGSYVRCQLAMEREIASHGQRWLIAGVPSGHEKFRAYLVERQGFRPYSEMDGTTFYLKDLVRRA